MSVGRRNTLSRSAASISCTIQIGNVKCHKQREWAVRSKDTRDAACGMRTEDILE